MLKRLTIKNYALIRELDILPSSHLNIITGETGAGKSIMLGAVGLMLGNRVDTKVLFNQEEKCIIEGFFDLTAYDLKEFFTLEDLDYSEECIIRREISPGGKSRGFINDTPVKLETMKALGQQLIDIHSQTDTVLLSSNQFQTNIIDIYADTTELMERYRMSFKLYRGNCKTYEDLKNQADNLSSESDYHSFLYEELEKAGFNDGEQEDLEGQSKMMEHAEEIKQNLNQVLALLQGNEISVQSGLSEANRLLEQLGNYSDSLFKLSERIRSLLIELDDVIRELATEENNVAFDPGQMESVQERLSQLYHLQQKHKVNSIKELLQIQDSLSEKIVQFENMDQYVAEARQKMEESRKDMLQNAHDLSAKRVDILKKLAIEIETLLKHLGIPDCTIEIDHKKVDPYRFGIDEFSFKFSANKGIKPAELSKVASGGEFARLMLCIKYIMASKTAMPTIVFDEIDNGVSGEIAHKLGTMMSKMGDNHQVFIISHLPQVAAMGDTHYFVFKEFEDKKTLSKIKLLNQEERLAEIAKMLSGDKPTESAYNNARELLAASV